MLKFYEYEKWDEYGSRVEKDYDVMRTFYNLDFWAKVDISSEDLTRTKAPLVMAWIARNVPYDVYCIKTPIKRPPTEEEVEKYTKELGSSLFGKNSHTNKIYEFRKEGIVEKEVWRFHFCDPQDATLFKLSWE